MVNKDKLGPFLREVSNWQWDEFVRAEHDSSYTSNQAIIFGLVRSCAMQKVDAIRMSLNRLDGKLKTPLKIEYPKIFYLFPNAKENQKAPDKKALNGSFGADVVDDTGEEVKEDLSVDSTDITTISPPESEMPNDLPSLSLRETLIKMSDFPRDTPAFIIDTAQKTEWALRDHGEMPDDIPMVKSVVAAHLLTLASKRNMDAITEVFDQIDGKLAEVVQIVGEDIYITSYAEIVPPGAYKNKDGVWEISALSSENIWAERLGRSISGV